MKKEILRFSGVDKKIGDTVLLQNLSFCIFEGEALGIVGLHESGKTAILNLISGEETFDSGSVFFDEERITGNKLQLKSRIAMIRRASSMVGPMSFFDNVLVLRKQYHFQFLIRRRVMRNRLHELLNELGVSFSLDETAESMPKIKQYIAEIVKAYILDARIVLIDDYSGEYSLPEQSELAHIISCCKKRGMSFLITSNQIRNLQEPCDRLMVLGKERVLKIFESKQITAPMVENILLGDTPQRTQRTENKPNAVVFDARGIRTDRHVLLPVTLYRGEFAAILDPYRQDSIDFFYAIQTPQRQPADIVFSPDICMKAKYPHRLRQVVFTDFDASNMVVENMTLRDNLLIADGGKTARAGFIHQPSAQFVEREFRAWCGFDFPLCRQNCKGIGEREKVAIFLYRLMIQKVKILFCFDPRDHVDMATNRYIVQKLRQLADSEMTICVSVPSLGGWEGYLTRSFRLRSGFDVHQQS